MVGKSGDQSGRDKGGICNNNNISNKIDSLYRVQQRSVFSPLLFTLYTNGVENVLQHSFVSYDMLISVAGSNIDKTVSLLNAELCILYDWLAVCKQI